MINKEKLYTLFARYHAPLNQSTNGWYSATCPFCGKEKLAINFNYNIVKCWRNCFKAGFIIDFICKYRGISYFEAHELIDAQEEGLFHIPSGIVRIQKKSELILPLGTVPILFGDTVLGQRARDYLVDRRFDLNYLDRIGVGYCTDVGKYFGYLIIPFKRRGILSYFIARDFIKNFPRYKNPDKKDCGIGKGELLFNEEALYLYDKVYLCEGWADAATLQEQGVSYQGSQMSVIQRNSVIKSPVESVVIVPDRGFYCSGLQMAADIIKFKMVKVLDLQQIVLLDDPEAKDPNDLGKNLIFQLEQVTDWLTSMTLFKELRKNEKSGIAH